MKTGHMRVIARGWLGVLLGLALAAAGQDSLDPVQAPPQGMLEATPPQAQFASGGEDEEAGALPGASPSQAEEHFRRGVGLYKRDLYREALNEFNRALALDPGLVEAKSFQVKCNAKLQLSAMGAQPGEVPAFDTFDPRTGDFSSRA